VTLAGGSMVSVGGVMSGGGEEGLEEGLEGL
jgi:hypothetical protein